MTSHELKLVSDGSTVSLYQGGHLVSSSPVVPEALLNTEARARTRRSERTKFAFPVPAEGTPPQFAVIDPDQIIRPSRRASYRITSNTPDFDAARVRVLVRREFVEDANVDLETGEIRNRVWDATRAVKKSLETDAISASPLGVQVADLEAVEARRRTFALQDTAAEVLSSSRTCHCNRTRIGSAVDVRVAPNGQAYFGGLQTCGSVWACPVCAARVTGVRRDELNEALKFARTGGLYISMLTLTAPHGPKDDLGQLQRGHREAYRYFTSGKRALKTLLGAAGYVGTIRGQEVTHGEMGWHPHWHTLILTASPITAEQKQAILGQWQRSAARAGLGVVSLAALDLKACPRLSGDEAVNKLGLYVVKWGASEELTRSHVKKAGRGGRSPWQILADAGECPRSAQLFKEYARVYKGQRQLVWSAGLRALMGLKEPLTDQEAAEKEPDGYAVALVMDKAQWSLIRAKQLRLELLEAASVGVGPLVLSVGVRAGNAARQFIESLDWWPIATNSD